MTRTRRRAVTALATIGSLLALAGCSGGSADEGDAVDSVTAQVLPPIAQVGARPAGADGARAVVSALVEPAEPGIAVSLERQDGESWAEVSSRETDDGGAAAFVLDESPEGASYRVVADGATSEPVTGDGWTVAFSDEFEGDALDDAAWFHRGPDYNPDGYRACSKGSPDAVDVSDGALRLRVVRDPDRSDTCTAKTEEGKNLGQFDYRLNGHVASKSLFTYGVTAARIKFPRDRGQHGSFWYQTPLALEGDAASAGAEIDVVEYFGEDGENRLASFVHYPTPDGDVKEGDWIEDADRFLASKDDDWWKQFHVFSLQWTPEEYVIRIDGQEAWRTDQGISEQQQFVVLSLLSSDYELPKLGGEDKLPQEMVVDWLRVYGG